MPPTLTTRLGLSKPDSTDLYDIGIFNGNADIIDAVNGITICTSSTRPSTPKTGQLIFETDTNLLRTWLSGAWSTLTPTNNPSFISIVTSSTRPSSPAQGRVIYETDTGLLQYWDSTGSPQWRPLTLSNTSIPLGVKGGKRYTTAATLGTITTAEALAGMDTGSITLEANQTYICKIQVEVAVSVATTDCIFRVRQTNLAGAIIGTFRTPPMVVTTKTGFYFEIPIVGPSAGATTYVLTAQRGTGTPTITITATAGVVPFMVLEKVGSNTILTAV
jgi:hypothetical protein